ncbi:hypothetical protein ACA910_001657 [Epithemia clementina (nom. ined.)]
MSVFSALICAADCALRMEDSHSSSDGACSPSRKTKRSVSYHGPPHKRTLSDVSSCSSTPAEEGEGDVEDIDLVNAPIMDKTMEYSTSMSYREETTTTTTTTTIMPPPPSPEKCARNARAKMVLLIMDQNEEKESMRNQK